MFWGGSYRALRRRRWKSCATSNRALGLGRSYRDIPSLRTLCDVTKRTRRRCAIFHQDSPREKQKNHTHPNLPEGRQTTAKEVLEPPTSPSCGASRGAFWIVASASKVVSQRCFFRPSSAIGEVRQVWQVVDMGVIGDANADAEGVDRAVAPAVKACFPRFWQQARWRAGGNGVTSLLLGTV
jgi:hypothetical protein